LTSLDLLVLKAEAEGDVVLIAAKDFEEVMKIYNSLLNHLQDHAIIIAVFEKALSSSGWPKDDAADPQDFLRCNEVLAGMRSGLKRSRSVVEANDDLLRPPVPKQLSS
jgi:hypothetical protein